MSTPPPSLSHDALLERCQALEQANKKLVNTVEVYKERTVNIAALVDKYKHLNQLHQALQEDHASISKQLADSRKAQDSAKAKNAQKTAELMPLKTKLRRETAAKDALAVQLDEAKSTARAAEAAHKAEQKRAAELQKERDALAAAAVHGTLRSQGPLEALQEEMAVLKGAVEAVRCCSCEAEINELRRTVDALVKRSFTEKLPAMPSDAPSADSDSTQMQNALQGMRMQLTVFAAEFTRWRSFFRAIVDSSADLGANTATGLQHCGAPTSSCTPTNPRCHSSSAFLGDDGSAWEVQRVGIPSQGPMHTSVRKAGGGRQRASMQSSTTTAAVIAPAAGCPTGNKRTLATREEDREGAEQGHCTGSGEHSKDSGRTLPVPQRCCTAQPSLQQRTALARPQTRGGQAAVQMELLVEDAPLPRRRFRRSEKSVPRARAPRLMQLGSGKVKSTAVAGSGFVFNSAEEVARWQRIQSEHPEWNFERGAPAALASEAAAPNSRHAASAAEEAATCTQSVEDLFDGSEDYAELEESPVVLDGAPDTEQQAASCSLHDWGHAIERAAGTKPLAAEHRDQGDLSCCRADVAPSVAPSVIAQVKRHMRLSRALPPMQTEDSGAVTCSDAGEARLGSCGTVKDCMNAARRGASPSMVALALAPLVEANAGAHATEVISNCIASAVAARALPCDEAAAQLLRGCADALSGEMQGLLGAIAFMLRPVRTAGDPGSGLEAVVAAVLALRDGVFMAAVATRVDAIALSRAGDAECGVSMAALAGISVILHAHAAEWQELEHTLQGAEGRFARLRSRGGVLQLGAALGELSHLSFCSRETRLSAEEATTHVRPTDAMVCAVWCAMAICFEWDESLEDWARKAWIAVRDAGAKAYGWPPSVGAGSVAAVAQASVASLESAVSAKGGENSMHDLQWTSQRQLQKFLGLCDDASGAIGHANTAEHVSAASTMTSESSDGESTATGTTLPTSPRPVPCHLGVLRSFAQQVASALRIAAAVSDWRFVADVLVEGIVWPALERIAAGEKSGAGDSSAARLAVCSLSGLCEDLLVHVEAQGRGEDAAATFVAEVREALVFMR